MSGLPRGERADVWVKDDPELDWENATEENYEIVEVFDHVTVVQESYVNSVNGHKTFTIKIAGGDSKNLSQPEAVTERVANYILDEFGIDLKTSDRFDIRVVDVKSDNVWVP